MKKELAFNISFKRNLYLLLLLVLCNCFNGKIWGAKPIFLKPVGQFNVPESVRAMAFTADESMVAIAMEMGGETLLEIREFTSGKIIHKLNSPGNSVSELVFDFRQNLLAVSGEKRIELWDLEIPKGKAFEKISMSSRIWEEATTSPSVPSFSTKSAKLRWINGNDIREIPLKPPFIASQVWTGEKKGTPLNKFRFDPEERMLALNEKDRSEIRLVNPWQKTIFPGLDYHLFPVVDMFFSNGNRLVSLDQEHNLAWGEVHSRTKTSPPPRANDIKKGRAARMIRLYRDHVLIYTTENPHEAIVTDRRGIVYHSFSLAFSSAVAVSPTGRYVLIADAQKRIREFQTVLHQSPELYLDQLRHLGAKETARRFQNQLPGSVSELPKAVTNTDNKNLKRLEENLNVSEKTKQWSETERIAREILTHDLNNQKALEALERLASLKHDLILEQGQQMLEKQKFAEAVNLLKQIPPDNPLYLEARNLIALADRSVQTSLTLRNAQEQLKIGNWEGATVLLNQVLKVNPLNKQAAELLEEAELFGLWSTLEKTLYLLLMLSAALILFWWLYKKRENFFASFSPKEESVTIKTFRNINLKDTISSQVNPDEKKFRDTLKKTKEFLSLAQKKDISGEQAGRLIDFETEIKIIAEKSEKLNADYKHLNTQLMVLLQTLRGMNFKSSNRQKKKGNSKNPGEQSSSVKVNYYELLGVKPTATDDEIKKAFHSKIKEYHPDRHQKAEFNWVREQAASMSRNLTEAYEVLINQESRQRYDSNLN